MSSAIPGKQSYNNLSSWRLARWQAWITTWETRLVAVHAQQTQLLENPNESYSFNAGEGSQSATKRKLDALAREEDRLVRLIEKYTSLIYGGGLVAHNVRRK